MSFSYRFTLLTPLVESTGRVSKSDVAMTKFWLALTEVGCITPSWFMVVAMALGRALALMKSMVVAYSIPSVALR
jgi:hypothetical protein